MAHLHSQKNFKPTFGFITEWKIDRKVFTDGKPILTDEKTIEGIPGVTWSLECNPCIRTRYDRSNQVAFYLNIYSEEHICCQTEFKCKWGEPIRSNNQIKGEKQIELQKISHETFFDPSESYLSSSADSITLHFNVTCFYNGESVIYPMRCNPVEWKDRFMQQLPTEFEIIVGDESIKVIKPFISAESDVFERMFEADFLEAKEKRAKIEGYSFDTVKAAIDYCNGDDIGAALKGVRDEPAYDEDEIAVTPKNECIAIELLNFANQYNFKTLKPKMEAYFISKLDIKNVELLAFAADKANALELRQACVTLVQSLLNKNPDWPNNKLPTFDPAFMQDVLLQALKRH